MQPSPSKFRLPETEGDTFPPRRKKVASLRPALRWVPSFQTQCPADVAANEVSFFTLYLGVLVDRAVVAYGEHAMAVLVPLLG